MRDQTLESAWSAACPARCGPYTWGWLLCSMMAALLSLLGCFHEMVVCSHKSCYEQRDISCLYFTIYRAKQVSDLKPDVIEVLHPDSWFCYLNLRDQLDILIQILIPVKALCIMI